MQPPPQPPQPEPAGRRASSTCSASPRRSSGIGCMAGLLRLISPYHRSHHRRRLTATHNAPPRASESPPPSSPPRKKAAAGAATQPFASPAASSPLKPPMTQQQLMTTAAAAVRRRRSCDAPRSPTIAPEHRRSSCDSPRPPPPPAIIARLMGLEESAPPSPAAGAASATAPRPVVVPTRPPPPPPTPTPPPETAAEKRRKLLGALEKCDEDLKTLRRIIAAVRAAEMRAASASDAAICPPAAHSGKGGAKRTFARDNGPSPSPSPSPSPPAQEKQQQYPSPVSVLDAISSPRFPCRKRPSPCTDLDVGAKGGACRGNGALVAPTVGARVVKPSRTLVFSGDYYCKIKSGGAELAPPLLHGVHYSVVVGTPRSAGAESWRHHHNRRRWEQEAAAAGRVISRATAESVQGEAILWVRQQGAHGDERGRVAAALERAIVQDLVADLVAELRSGHDGGGAGSIGCRKRLCF